MPFDVRAWHERLERLSSPHSDAWAPAIDVYETTDTYVVTAEVPGVSRDEIELAFGESRLTLRGQRADRRVRTDGIHFHQVERSHGSFTRTFEFGGRIDVERVTADLKDGVLTITLPKAPPEAARRIDVR
jgi:HSP20 family protein